MRIARVWPALVARAGEGESHAMTWSGLHREGVMRGAVEVAPRLKVLKTVEPSSRKAGVKVGSVEELIEKLKNEAGVI